MQALNIISCQLSNMTMKKGKSPRKPEEQFQPDYVKKAKSEARNAEQKNAETSREEIEEMQKFWENYNNRVRKSNDGN